MVNQSEKSVYYGVEQGQDIKVGKMINDTNFVRRRVLEYFSSGSP